MNTTKENKSEMVNTQFSLTQGKVYFHSTCTPLVPAVTIVMEAEADTTDDTG